MFLTYEENEDSKSVDVNNLNDLMQFCKDYGILCSPMLESQLLNYNITSEVVVDSDDPILISISNTYNGEIHSEKVQSFNDVCCLVQKIFYDEHLEFQPIFPLQLQEGGGWDQDQIIRYKDFVKEVQSSLPKDYRLIAIEQQLDTYIKFWNNISRPSEVKVDTIIEQLVELKTVVFD